MVSMAASVGFTEADIERAAGAQSFERGLDYLDEVEDLEISTSQISASVYGRSKYTVCLTSGAKGLSGSCTCPGGLRGFFCRHCVAVGMSVLGMGEDLPRRIEAAEAERHALESWLGSLSTEELVAELLGLLDEDRDLRRRFGLRAAAVNADAAAVRRAIRKLLTVSRRDHIDLSQARDYAAKVYWTAGAIDDLIGAGGAADAVEIAREAIGLLAEAYECVDDSSGSVGDAAHELLAVHLRACETARPEPVSLGRYLAGLLLNASRRLVPDLRDYTELLGEKGTDAVRDGITAAYAENPTGWRTSQLMESVARAEGDVDALIAVYAADLDDRGRNHLRIARELDEAGRGDEALDWAERGLHEAARPDQQLIEYLAGRYAAAGRDDDVLNLRRTRFHAERTLAGYQALREAATDSGVWPAERSEALALLREDARAWRASRSRILSAWAGPVLVDALTDEGDLDAAWAAAKDGATETQWQSLADASAATRPADALAVYVRAIQLLRNQTGNAAYRRMAALLLSARACHQALDTTDAFRRYLAALRREQKGKRNLMKILDENGL
jgi:uncharacterized Zn finger protein